MNEPSTKLPSNLLFVAEQLSGYNRNRFKIESNGSSTASSGRIVTFNLPENALIDTASIRWHFDADAAKTSVSTLCGLLPESADAFIANLEVYINGIQVQQSSQDYNMVANTLRLGGYNRDSQRSKGRLVNHSQIFGSKSASTNAGKNRIIQDSGEKASLVVDQWAGFLNQVSTRFLPTSILGQIQIRITLAPDAVLSACSDASEANNLTSAEVTAAAGLKYELSNMYVTVDSIVVPDAYNQLLRNQLASNVLPLNYNEYYTFSQPNPVGTTLSNRFNLASGCIDKIYCVNRHTGYNVIGKAYDLAVDGAYTSPLQAIDNKFVGNYFASFSNKKSDAANADEIDGELRYSFNVNNVQYPQYKATNSDAMADVAYTYDKVGMKTDGILITSPTAFCRGQAVYTLQLNHPGMGLRCQSGYNSRGINSTIGFNMEGLDSASGTAVARESLAIVQTTAQLRIAAGRSLAVSF